MVIYKLYPSMAIRNEKLSIVINKKMLVHGANGLGKKRQNLSRFVDCHLSYDD